LLRALVGACGAATGAGRVAAAAMRDPEEGKIETDRSRVSSDSQDLRPIRLFLIYSGRRRYIEMRKGETTRQRIIEKSAPIFNQKGFTGCFGIQWRGLKSYVVRRSIRP
jgi:hypothetical protein